MAKTLCRVAGGGKPLKGNAEAGDVLAGKTFSNKKSNALTGTMPNNGAWSAQTFGSGAVTIPAGYHNGSGTVSGSASYNSGYTNGWNSGYTNAGFQLAVNTVLRSYGGTEPYPGNGNQNYTLTATETTWWVAGAVTVGSSARCTGQGSGILQAGQSRAFTAYTGPTDAPHEQAVVFITAWIKR